MRFVSIIALVVAAMVLTTGGVYLFDYVGEKDVTTTVLVQDGLSCTINGDPVTDGQTVTVNAEKKICIHIESESNALLAFSGKWSSEKKDVIKSGALTEAATTADFSFKLDRQDFNGTMAIYIAGADGDLAPINMTFNIDESKVSVSYSGGAIHNGDTVSFPGDGQISITSKIGRANIHYDYKWTNDCGFEGSASYDELNTSVTGTISNMCFFSTGTGTVNVSASPES